MTFASYYSRNEAGLILFPRDEEYRKSLFPFLKLSDHPAKANIYLVQAIVEHVSQPEETIMDIMTGTGTILTAALIGRQVICIEIEEEYWGIIEQAVQALEKIAPGISEAITIIPGDCAKVLPIPGADHIIFSPPYSNIMKKKKLDKLSAEMMGEGLLTYSQHPDNIGNLNEFLYCLHPLTRVLKADLTWVPIKDIKVGDELVGMDEYSASSARGVRRKLRRSVVEDKNMVVSDAYVIALTDNQYREGRVIIAGGEHPWLWVNRPPDNKDKHKVAWKRTDELNPGDKLKYLCEPWEFDSSYEAGYLSGLFDGEGSADGKVVSFSQKLGATMDRAQRLLATKGYSSGFYDYGYSSASLKLTHTKDCLRFLGSIRPKRLLTKSHLFWEGREPHGKDYEAEVSHVVRIGPMGLVNIQTSTHTFIAEGLITHNCQKMEIIYKKTLASLPAGGTLTIIIKDHIEQGERMHLGQRARDDCVKAGYEFVEWHRWKPPGSAYVSFMRARGDTVVEEEEIIILRRPL